MQNMNREATAIQYEFALKQIENEIQAGFVFVAAARRALAMSDPAKAESALEKAAETHQQAAVEAATSTLAQAQAVTHQLSELREAIDWLRETHLSPRAEK